METDAKQIHDLIGLAQGVLTGQIAGLAISLVVGYQLWRWVRQLVDTTIKGCTEAMSGMRTACEGMGRAFESSAKASEAQAHAFEAQTHAIESMLHEIRHGQMNGRESGEHAAVRPRAL